MDSLREAAAKNAVAEEEELAASKAEEAVLRAEVDAAGKHRPPRKNDCCTYIISSGFTRVPSGMSTFPALFSFSNLRAALILSWLHAICDVVK